MYPNNLPQPYRPRRARQSYSFLLVIVLVTAIVAGFVGGGISYVMLKNTLLPQAIVSDNIGNLQTEPLTQLLSTGNYASYTEAVADIAGPSVVEVSTESKVTHPFWGSYITSGAGSGVILTADGYIVTNHHVVEGSTSITVRLQDGQTYSATLIGSDEQTDLAVLKIDATGLAAATFADSDDVSVGQLAIAIGNPLGTLGGTVTEGIISAKDRAISIDGETHVLLQTSAAINPGNSGGGLFDKNGNLIGIVNAKSSGEDIEGLGFAIPSNTVREVVAQLMQYGYVTGRPSLGVDFVEINSREALLYYRLNNYGVYVSSMGQGEDGLQGGDRVVSIGSVSVTSEADVKDILSGYSVGDTVDVVVERSGRQVVIPVILEEQII